MNQTLLRTLCAAAYVVALTGCSANPKGAAPSTAAPSATHPLANSNAVFANQLADTRAGAPDAGAAARLRVVQLDVYQLVIPLGAISRSEEFWKHIDEESVDVGTYDLLRKNGWRLGVAPNNEWGYFRDIIDSYPASSKPSAIAAGPAGANGVMELPMKRNIPYQNIFYFSDQNRLYGRTFERCDNLLNIAFQQAPRKIGEARITVCPTVRSLRRRFEVTVKNDEKVIEYAYPERLYDLNLQVDIPMNHFLVIAPSPEVKWKTSLGAAFLIDDAAAERTEQVLLLVPRAAELQETTPTPPSPAPAQ